MAKRFFDTSMFSSPYIRGLGGAYKLLWIYMMQTCDHAGVWDVELDIASVRCGFEYNLEGCREAFGDGIHEFAGGAKWFLPAFIDEQYNGELNPANKVHASVIKILEKFSLNEIINKKNEHLIKPHTRGLEGAINNNKDKEKDKDKDKEQEEGGTGEETNQANTAEQRNNAMDDRQKDHSYILKNKNVNSNSMLLIEECQIMFLESSLCEKSRDELCIARQIMIKDPNRGPTELQRLKQYTDVFNQMHRAQLTEVMLLAKWCSHFFNWTGRIDLTVDPQQLFKNNNGTAKPNQQRTSAGRNTNAADVITPGRGAWD